MKIAILFLMAIGVLAATMTSPSFAVSRGIRTDAPGVLCFTPEWSQILSDPYGGLNGNGDGTQNPITFFNPGTVVTQAAIFCAPTIAFSVGTFPPQGDSANPASQPALNPDQTGCFNNTPQNCGSEPTVASLTAQGGVASTGGVMYEWINASDSNLTPDAEVIVWTLPSSVTLPNGALELEFDNWCSYNDGNNTSGSPPLLPPSPPPSFTWNSIQYEYLAGCGNFLGDDLLLDANSGAIVGYVVNSTDNTNNTIVSGSTARGWQAITTPGGLSAATGSGSVTLNWTPADGATSYNIYQSLTTGAEGKTAVKTGITAGSTVISGLNYSQLYFFTVAAVYSSTAYPSGVVSSQSAEASATVLAAPPTGLTAKAGTASIALHWTASVNASSYSIYQGTSSGGESATPIASGITNISYSATGLTAGQTYYFNVKAANAGGNSGASNEATTAVLAATPTGLTASGGNGSVSLSWTASSGATSYNVYQGTSAGSEGAVAVQSSSASTATISGLANGVMYFYKVSAVDQGGNSALSPEASATTAAPPTVPPPKSGGGGGTDLLDLLICSAALGIRFWRSTLRRKLRVG